jgi:hypothetical protein
MQKMKILFYTAIYGTRDVLVREHPDLPNCDFLCFTNTIENKNLTNWQSRIPHNLVIPNYSNYSEENKNIRFAKYFKLHPYLYKDYDYIIWVDANAQFKENFNLDALINTLGENNISTFKHPMSKSIFDELSLYLKYPKPDKEDPSVILKQILRFVMNSYNCYDNFIPATGAIVTRQCKAIIPFYDFWWRIICEQSHQDQLSFTYAADQTNTKFSTILGDVWEGKGMFFEEYIYQGNPWFTFNLHSA